MQQFEIQSNPLPQQIDVSLTQIRKNTVPPPGFQKTNAAHD
ncbi:MAG: hypothetical protein ABSF54_25960 [Bryobacteraceae bacterium]